MQHAAWQARSIAKARSMASMQPSMRHASSRTQPPAHLALQQLDPPAGRVQRHRLDRVELPVARMAREEDLPHGAAPDAAEGPVGGEVGSAGA